MTRTWWQAYDGSSSRMLRWSPSNKYTSLTSSDQHINSSKKLQRLVRDSPFFMKSCWAGKSIDCPPKCWQLLVRITLSIIYHGILVRLTEQKYSILKLWPSLCTDTITKRLQFLGIASWFTVTGNNLHTDPATMPISGLIMTGPISSGSASMLLFNPSSCPSLRWSATRYSALGI